MLSESLLEHGAAQAHPAHRSAGDPRRALIAVLLFGGLLGTLQSWPALLAALLLALSAAALAAVDWRRLTRRLLALEGLVLLLVISLPFSVPGEPAVAAFGITLSIAGLERAGQILLRVHAMAILLFGLLGRHEPSALLRGLGALGLPAKLVQLALFTLHYLHTLAAEAGRLHTAMRARAFRLRSNRHTWRTLGWLIGMLLVRSLARARRVHDAMRCRGFTGQLPPPRHTTRWRLGDSLWLGGFALALAVPLALEHLA